MYSKLICQIKQSLRDAIDHLKGLTVGRAMGRWRLQSALMCRGKESMERSMDHVRAKDKLWAVGALAQWLAAFRMHKKVVEACRRSQLRAGICSVQEECEARQLAKEQMTAACKHQKAMSLRRALRGWLACAQLLKRLKANVEHALEYCEPLNMRKAVKLWLMYSKLICQIKQSLRDAISHLKGLTVGRAMGRWRLQSAHLGDLGDGLQLLNNSHDAALNTLCVDRSAHYTAIGHQLGRQMSIFAIQMWKTKQRHSQQLDEELIKISELLELHTIQAQRCEQLQLKVVVNKEKASIRLHVHIIV